MTDRRDSTEPSGGCSLVEFSGLSFGYENRYILKDINLSIGEGEFVSIIGPSGCGKSTLLGLADGALRPDKGTVTIGGAPIVRSPVSRAMVFQSFALLPWKTALENVRLGLKYRRPDLTVKEQRAIAEEHLVNTGLAGFRDHYPHELSGGMQQRVGFARALSVDPALLLMDEPFGALDAQTAELLREDLLRLVSEDRRTVMFVTHNLDEALGLSDRVVLMGAQPGRVCDDIRIDMRNLPANEQGRVRAEHRDAIWSFLRSEIGRIQEHRAAGGTAS